MQNDAARNGHIHITRRNCYEPEKFYKPKNRPHRSDRRTVLCGLHIPADQLFPYTTLFRSTGCVAHRFGRLSACKDAGTAFKWSLAAAVCGLGFNMVFDPLFGYCYKLVILGRPMAELTLLPDIAATTVNAVTSTIVSVAVYNAVRPALKKAGMLPAVGRSIERGISEHTKSAV